MEQAYAYEREAEALKELRKTLESIGIRTESSSGNNEFFYAYLYRDRHGIIKSGLFIVGHKGTHFSWSYDGKHPMADIPGAAKRIEQIIRDQPVTGD